METSENIKAQVRNLPYKPGVYKFYNDEGEIIYIGKAKSLKKRVSSYFNKQQFESAKLKILVTKIRLIEHIVVDTESDALLLENNLIKKHQPKYNINLKDDKTFPWICVKNEEFPRIFSTRNKIKDGSKYFGPYTSVYTVRILLALIRELYPIRNCKLNLTKENIYSNKFKVCLEYHLGNCKGPCVGYQNEKDYLNSIEQIKKILNGNLADVILFLKNKMNEFSSKFEFEEAEKIKNKILALEKFQMKSTIVNENISNVDVFSIVEDQNTAFVNFIKLHQGSIIQAHNVEVKKRLDESKEELLSYAITSIRESLNSNSNEIIVPFLMEIPGCNAQIIVPQRGDKKKLLDLSMRNAKYYMLDKRKSITNSSITKSLERRLSTLKSDLHLANLPVHIECFDNSNIQGKLAVAACVVFRDLKPFKKEYRHFNIKTVTGPDDFASMEEVVYRRYKRLLDEKKSIPQLIVVDGGKGQLHAAVNSLEKLNLRGVIAIIGIAKRLEEIYFPDDPVPLYLDKNSESLKVIQYLRDEAHRFGISFHRLLRSGNMINSSLEEIDGIGEKSVGKLISHFGSLELLKKADKKEIIAIVGVNRANLLWNSFKKDKS